MRRFSQIRRWTGESGSGAGSLCFTQQTTSEGPLTYVAKSGRRRKASSIVRFCGAGADDMSRSSTDWYSP